MQVTPDNKEIVCEFHGIHITTKNPNIARILTKSFTLELKWFSRRENDRPQRASTIDAPALVP